MSDALPSRPNLEWLKNRAKERLAELRVSDPAARLADAQKDVARHYGFPSWRALKAHVDSVNAPAKPDGFTDRVVQAFFEGVGTGKIDAVRDALDRAPALANVVGPHPFWGGRPQALHVSIESDRRAAFDLLLERGASVDGANAGYMGWSPLLLSVYWKRADMTRDLLARGARVGLAEALVLADDARVDALLADGLPSAVPNDGTWLHFARTTHAIDRLLAAGARIDRNDFWGASPVEALSRSGPAGAPLVAHLVARGAKAGATELARMNDRAALAQLPADELRDPRTLKAAVDFGHRDLVRWLVERGADVNARADDQARQTPLHSAAWNGDLAMAMLLVELGADVRARDRQYDGTPLGWAETAREITNNPACDDVAAFLRDRS